MDKKHGLAVSKRLYGYTKKYVGFSLFALFGLGLYALSDYLLVSYTKPLIDTGLISKKPEFVATAPFCIIGIFLLRGIANSISGYFVGLVGRSVTRDLRHEIMTKLMYLPNKVYAKFSSAELLSKVSYDTEQVASAVSDAVATAIKGLFTAIALIILMFSINWQLTIILLTVAPVIGLFLRFAAAKLRRYSIHIQNSMADIAKVANEIIKAQLLVKNLNSYAREAQKITYSTEDNKSKALKVIAVSSISAPVMQFIGSLGLALLCYLSTSPNSYVNTTLSAGEFVAIFGATLNLLRPIKQVASINNVLQQAIAGAHSIFSLLDKEQEQIDKGICIENTLPNIEFKNLNFKYDAKQPQNTLDNISLEIIPGENVVFVGRSGAGKSTILSLIPKFYDIPDSSIFINGHDINEISLRSLRDKISIVPQDIFLFESTIANNISYGCNASFSDIVKASKQANLYEFIQTLPQKFNTLIGENGSKLSGGQRQRIAIARVFLQNRDILILDEATSGLDNNNEAIMQATLKKYKGHKTVLIATHKLNTIKNADKIVVLENGKIIEVGSYESLLSKKQYFYNLHNGTDFEK